MGDIRFDKLDWTTASSKGNCPYLHLQGGRLEGSQLKQSIINAIRAAGAGDNSYIEDLYEFQDDSTETVRMPFFNTTFNSFTNQFADTFSQITTRGTKIWGDDIANSIRNTIDSLRGGWEQVKEMFTTGVFTGDTEGPPGTYIEVPKFWQASNTVQPIEVSFVLSNTVRSGGAERNLEAINDFAKLNKPVRHGIKLDYPCVWKLKVPGHRYMEWAYCNSFSVGMLGTRKMKNGVLIPEAYSCQFSFISLTMEDASLIDKAR